jgi:WhiB family transcriptional regulator, redox-sensing transcriptional regulator
MKYPQWTDTPACRGTNTEMWFAEDSEPGYREANLLKRICADCPVKQQCLEYSLHNSVQGYWAGTTPRRRTELRKLLNIVPKPVGLAWEIHEYGKVI